MWILETAADSEAGRLIFRIPSGEIKTIGRAPRADFILDAPLVSRLHCQLTANPAGLEIFDLHSTNGTFVNDRRVTQATLSPGDWVRLGHVSLLVSVAALTAPVS
jgi:pSer/pThr/pTyr-binding forkhead associated (FHA) protein